MVEMLSLALKCLLISQYNSLTITITVICLTNLV